MHNARMRIGFLASHNGSSLRAIVAALRSGVLKGTAQVVISNNRESPALDFARRETIAAHYINEANCAPSENADQAIARALDTHGVDLVVLSGYMRKIGPLTLQRYPARILNIHPGPLPKFGGRGMYGMNVHKAVLAAGEAITGVAIHVVDGEYDQGPVVAETAIPVLPEDAPEDLAQRVSQAEPDFFVSVLRRIQAGEIRLPEGLGARHRPPP